jgi:hypothetical protein
MRLKKRLIARYSGRTNVHLLHIRKTGGTALKQVFNEHPITPKCVLHHHPHRFTLRHVPSGHWLMFVTRDPVSRYISGFGSRLRQGAPAGHVPWTADEALAFSRFSDPNSLALALDPSHPMHTEALHAMGSISHIRYTHWDWFENEDAFTAGQDRIFFIGRTETLDADFEELKKPLGLPPGLTLAQDPKGANRGSQPASQAPVLETAAVEWLKSWYRRDYDFLDLCDRWRARQGGPVAKSWC